MMLPQMGCWNIPVRRPVRDRGPLPEDPLRPSRWRLGVPPEPSNPLQPQPAAWFRESTKVATKVANKTKTKTKTKTNRPGT